MDIFRFAGLAFMLSGFFFRIKAKPLAIVGISLLLRLIGRVLAGLPEMTGDLAYLAVLLLCYAGTLSVFDFDMAPFYSLADDAFL